MGDTPKTTHQAMHMGWAGAKGITNPSNDSWLDGFIDELRISKVVRNFAGPPVISDKVTILPNQPTTATSYSRRPHGIPAERRAAASRSVAKYRTDTLSAFSRVALTAAGPTNVYRHHPRTTFGKQVQYYYKVTDNNAHDGVVPERLPKQRRIRPGCRSISISRMLEGARPDVRRRSVRQPGGPLPNNCTIVTRVQKDYSTDVPTGGGTYSWQLKTHPGIAIDSNWVEAKSPFLAVRRIHARLLDEGRLRRPSCGPHASSTRPPRPTGTTRTSR